MPPREYDDLMTLDAVETIYTFNNNVLRIEAFENTKASALTMGTQTEPLNDPAATSNSSPPRSISKPPIRSIHFHDELTIEEIPYADQKNSPKRK